MRSHSSGMRYDALVLTIVSLFVVSYAAPTPGLYVSPTGSPEWSGNCSDTVVCNITSPCGLPTSPIELTDEGTACKLMFFPGNYSGLHLAIEDSKNVNIEFGDLEWEHEKRAAELPKSTVSDLSFFIRSTKLSMFGNLAYSKLNVSLEKSISTFFDELNATQSTFVFSASAPIAYPARISSSEARFSLQGAPGSEITFDIGAAANGSVIRKIELLNSRVYLSKGYSGLIHSSGGVGPSTIALTNTDTVDAEYLYSFDELVATEMTISNSKIGVISNIFKSTNGVDPITFNSEVKPLTLTVSQATIKGPVNSFAQIYDTNGCVNLDVSISTITNLDINCNAPTSVNAKDRCTYSVRSTTFRDNRLCVSGTGSTSKTPRWDEVGIVVSTPPIAPVMTLFNNIVTKSNTWTILTTVTRQPSDSPTAVVPIASSPSSNNVPFLLAGSSKLTGTVSAQYLTLETSAQVTFDRIMLDADSKILLRDGSSLISGRNIQSHLISSPASFNMDGTGFATVDLRSLEWYLTVYPDPVSIANNAPLLSLGAGVSMLLPVDTSFFKMFLQVNWNKTLLGAPEVGKAYVLTNNAIFSRNDPGYHYQFTSGTYTFDGWAEPNNLCANCRTVFFGLPRSGVVPVYLPPAPITITPVKTPQSNIDDCRGWAPSSQGWVCRRGSWEHDGDWHVTSNVTLVGSGSGPTKFNVKGALTFAPYTSINIAGSTAGLVVKSCAEITNPHQILLDYASGYPYGRIAWTHFVLDQSYNCAVRGATIPFTVLTPPADPKSCDFVLVKPENYGSTGLMVSFSVQERSCPKDNKLVYIIIGIVGGVLVLAGIIGLVIFIKRRRDAKARSHNGGFSSDYEPLINN